MNPSRRGLITGLISFVAAPAVVKASSLMPVKVVDFTPTYSFGLPPLKEEGMSVAFDVGESEIRKLLTQRIAEAQEEMRQNMSRMLFENRPLLFTIKGVNND